LQADSFGVPTPQYRNRARRGATPIRSFNADVKVEPRRQWGAVVRPRAITSPGQAPGRPATTARFQPRRSSVLMMLVLMLVFVVAVIISHSTVRHIHTARLSHATSGLVTLHIARHTLRHTSLWHVTWHTLRHISLRHVTRHTSLRRIPWHTWRHTSWWYVTRHTALLCQGGEAKGKEYNAGYYWRKTSHSAFPLGDMEVLLLNPRCCSWSNRRH